MTVTIGVDIGGTKIAGGLVDLEGAVLARARRDTPARSSDGIVAAIIEVVRDLIVVARDAGLAADNIVCGLVPGREHGGFVSQSRHDLVRRRKTRHAVRHHRVGRPLEQHRFRRYHRDGEHRRQP